MQGSGLRILPGASSPDLNRPCYQRLSRGVWVPAWLPEVRSCLMSWAAGLTDQEGLEDLTSRIPGEYRFELRFQKSEVASSCKQQVSLTRRGWRLCVAWGECSQWHDHQEPKSEGVRHEAATAWGWTPRRKGRCPAMTKVKGSGPRLDTDDKVSLEDKNESQRFNHPCLIRTEDYNHWRDCFPDFRFFCPIHQTRIWILIRQKTLLILL